MVSKLLKERLTKSNSSFGGKEIRVQTETVLENGSAKGKREAVAEPLYILRYDD